MSTASVISSWTTCKRPENCGASMWRKQSASRGKEPTAAEIGITPMECERSVCWQRRMPRASDVQPQWRNTKEPQAARREAAGAPGEIRGTNFLRSLAPVLLTPKALHSIAQGRERSEHTLGRCRPCPTTPQGLHRASLVQPLRGRSAGASQSQGALTALATLGCGVQRLRRKDREA